MIYLYRYNRQAQKPAKAIVDEDGSSSSEDEMVVAPGKNDVAMTSSAAIPADDGLSSSESTTAKATSEEMPKKRKVSNAKWTGDMVKFFPLHMTKTTIPNSLFTSPIVIQ